MLDNIRRKDLSDKIGELLCIKPEEFDPDKHVPYAQEIVNQLDGLLQRTPKIRLSVDIPRLGKVYLLGPMDENETYEESVGEYRVQKYRAGWNERVLECRHYWRDSERELIVYEETYETLGIYYHKKSLGINKVVKNIERINPTATPVGYFSIDNPTKINLWKKKK
ncbi:hypothetical protein HYY69_03565 [Candidatus Woesearchaeota archaeon]|nr:hypothetical protein [Candidatus Woesearchaeota archaeon]